MEVDLLKFLPADLLIVVIAIYTLGIFLKNSKAIKDNLIPLILLIVAILITIVYSAVILGEGFTPATITNGFIYGIIVAAVAVFWNQLLKQLLTVKKRE